MGGRNLSFGMEHPSTYGERRVQNDVRQGKPREQSELA